jgi:GPH family glycoside/pentoside/hexuronide:cation symporter
MAGWSILINIISVMLIYFYLPPSNSGLVPSVPQFMVFGIFTLLSLILASGRLIDAVTDPLIAWTSDRFKSRWGRRRPFMLISIIPSVVFCILIFYPWSDTQADENYYSLFLYQALFYFMLTLYIVPYNALMPELAETEDKRIRFSTMLSLTYVTGVVIASQLPLLAEKIGTVRAEGTPSDHYRIAINILAVLAGILMLVPVLVVDENRYCKPVESAPPLKSSLLKVIKNRRFLVFLIADASFFITIAIITSGIIYYVNVLLGMPESLASRYLAIMIILSLVCYPFMKKLTQKFGKKALIIYSFLSFSMVFMIILFSNRMEMIPSNYLMLFIAIISAPPTAVLGILPYAIIAEIAGEESRRSGDKIEAMFYAVRTFTDKLGQTLGVMSFAILTIFGKDPGDDLGIRLSALLGAVVCILAALAFTGFRD